MVILIHIRIRKKNLGQYIPNCNCGEELEGKVGQVGSWGLFYIFGNCTHFYKHILFLETDRGNCKKFKMPRKCSIVAF